MHVLLVLVCLHFLGELTLLPHLPLTDNANISLTSLPPPKQFMATMIISQQQQRFESQSTFNRDCYEIYLHECQGALER